jgi:hypothetical protein
MTHSYCPCGTKHESESETAVFYVHPFISARLSLRPTTVLTSDFDRFGYVRRLRLGSVEVPSNRSGALIGIALIH